MPFAQDIEIVLYPAARASAVKFRPANCLNLGSSGRGVRLRGQNTPREAPCGVEPRPPYGEEPVLFGARHRVAAEMVWNPLLLGLAL